MKITTLGIDLAKNVFQLHGADERGHAVLKKQLKRSQMKAFFVNVPPCLIGLEALRFVPIKNIEQQAVLSLHRVRQGRVKARTAQSNQLRGLLAEFGLTLPPGIGQIARHIPALLEDAGHDLPDLFRHLMSRLLTHFNALQCQVLELEVQIKAWHRENTARVKLAEIPGVGPITATARVASG